MTHYWRFLTHTTKKEHYILMKQIPGFCFLGRRFCGSRARSLSEARISFCGLQGIRCSGSCFKWQLLPWEEYKPGGLARNTNISSLRLSHSASAILLGNQVTSLFRNLQSGNRSRWHALNSTLFGMWMRMCISTAKPYSHFGEPCLNIITV